MTYNTEDHITDLNINLDFGGYIDQFLIKL